MIRQSTSDFLAIQRFILYLGTTTSRKTNRPCLFIAVLYLYLLPLNKPPGSPSNAARPARQVTIQQQLPFRKSFLYKNFRTRLRSATN
jgi:hypothetical protein